MAVLSMVPRGSPPLALAVAHEALMIPIFALCISHANDYVPNSRMMETSGGRLLAFSIGATIGALTASFLMRGSNAGGLFLFIGVVLFALGVLAVFRLIIDAGVRRTSKVHFAPSPASPAVFPLEADHEDPRS